jgi:hypothetical protein
MSVKSNNGANANRKVFAGWQVLPAKASESKQ